MSDITWLSNVAQMDPNLTYHVKSQNINLTIERSVPKLKILIWLLPSSAHVVGWSSAPCPSATSATINASTFHVQMVISQSKPLCFTNSQAALLLYCPHSRESSSIFLQMEHQTNNEARQLVPNFSFSSSSGANCFHSGYMRKKEEGEEGGKKEFRLALPLLRLLLYTTSNKQCHTTASSCFCTTDIVVYMQYLSLYNFCLGTILFEQI